MGDLLSQADQAPTARTILVIDNERAILHLTQTILRTHGYRVLIAEDGHSAVEMYRQDPTAIDVVLVDQNMPGLSGLETMNELLAINPQQRIWLMTGGEPPEVSWGVNNPHCGFLSKPWTTLQLLEAVRGM
ncbi:MAG TPA: response regulator [Gemmataceae bacterium]|nr:response regulator [Gemmataceae bacterium]